MPPRRSTRRASQPSNATASPTTTPVAPKRSARTSRSRGAPPPDPGPADHDDTGPEPAAADAPVGKIEAAPKKARGSIGKRKGPAGNTREEPQDEEEELPQMAVEAPATEKSNESQAVVVEPDGEVADEESGSKNRKAPKKTLKKTPKKTTKAQSVKARGLRATKEAIDAAAASDEDIAEAAMKIENEVEISPAVDETVPTEEVATSGADGKPVDDEELEDRSPKPESVKNKSAEKSPQKQEAPPEESSDEESPGPAMPEPAVAVSTNAAETDGNHRANSSDKNEVSSDEEAPIPAMPHIPEGTDVIANMERIAKKRVRDIDPTDLPTAKKKFKVLKPYHGPVKTPAPQLQVLLDGFPSSDMYEKSYMHRDVVTKVAASNVSGFIITASRDGQLKLWRKNLDGVDFVKQFRAHPGPLSGMALSADGNWLVTASHVDKTVKSFDVVGFDMVNFVKLNFTPSCVEWTHTRGAPEPTFAVSAAFSTDVYIYKASSTEPVAKFSGIHPVPIVHMKFNHLLKAVVSSDTKGILEFWDPQTGRSDSIKGLAFSLKSETDLFDFVRSKALPMSLEVSSNGKLIACFGDDGIVRVFNLKGKIVRKYVETLPHLLDVREMDSTAQVESAIQGPLQSLDGGDFGRRVAREKELWASINKAKSAAGEIEGSESEASLSALSTVYSSSLVNAVFDESSRFLLYPSLVGIKIVSLDNNSLVRLVGYGESAERFCSVALYQGTPQVAKGTSTEKVEEPRPDPTIIATSLEKQRLFLFTNRGPEDDETGTSATGRDVYNERPMRLSTAPAPGGKAGVSVAVKPSAVALPSGAVIYTSKGDIELTLYPDSTPRTFENFAALAKRGYYNDIIFHRVIRGFMLQTGDPEGDGTGGESCWGGMFEDEIRPLLKHTQAGTLSMANAGPNTNGSQFFITCAATPWLDGKHTVFGRVTKGLDVVRAIENVRTDKGDRPLDVVKMYSISLR